jgi:hypothetical protein
MFTKMKLFALSLVLVGGAAGMAAANAPGPGKEASGHHAKKFGKKHDRTAFKAKLLAKYDANKDGSLDDAEKAVMRRERAQRQFARLDANGDGVLTLDEFLKGKRRGKWGR